MSKEEQSEVVKAMAELIVTGKVPAGAVSLPTRTSVNTDELGNILANAELLAWIRKLPDFDLIMLLSDIDQFGWDMSLQTIAVMKDAGL